MVHTYNITGMTCNGCATKIKSELLRLGDVLSAEVQLNRPNATITMQKHIETAVLQAALDKAGAFTITEAWSDHSQQDAHEEEAGTNSLFPIWLISAYIIGVSLLIQLVGHFSWHQLMSHVMAGFFLVFSFFKLLNLKGFAEGYATYDIIARKFPTYGLIYPFIELTLGVAFLAGYNPILTNSVTLVVMSVSSIGVIQSLLKKRKFQCACLGTVIKLPLTTVTLAEDLLMAAMSAVMLIIDQANQ